VEKNARLAQSSPEQSDPLTWLIVKLILWSTKIGRGWSRTPVFPDKETEVKFNHQLEIQGIFASYPLEKLGCFDNM
jgi:hypothetical protein